MAAEAHRVLEGALRSSKDLGDGVGIGDVFEVFFTSEAELEGSIVLDGMEDGRDFTHGRAILKAKWGEEQADPWQALPLSGRDRAAGPRNRD